MGRGRRRSDAIFFVVLSAIVTANVVLFVLVRPHHAAGGDAGSGAATTAARPSHRGGTGANRPTARSSTTKPTRRHRGGTRLVVRAARGPSWLQVRRGSATGPVVYEGTLGAGRRLTLTAPALYLRLGAVANVDVRVDQRLVDLRCTAADGVVVANSIVIPVEPSSCGNLGS